MQHNILWTYTLVKYLCLFACFVLGDIISYISHNCLAIRIIKIQQQLLNLWHDLLNIAISVQGHDSYYTERTIATPRSWFMLHWTHNSPRNKITRWGSPDAQNKLFTLTSDDTFLVLGLKNKVDVLITCLRYDLFKM